MRADRYLGVVDDYRSPSVPPTFNRGPTDRSNHCLQSSSALTHSTIFSWMCHFDDDNYVNIPQLMRMLGNFDPRRDWYLGRPSTRGPIDIVDRLDEPAKKVSNLVDVLHAHALCALIRARPIDSTANNDSSHCLR